MRSRLYNSIPMTKHTSHNMLFQILVGIFLLSIATVGILFWMSDPLFLKAPSDANLIKVFQTHKNDFEKLRGMIVEDHQSYISKNHLDDGLGLARKQAYLTLLKQIGENVVLTSDDRSTRFIFANGGLLTISSGWMKGIEHSSTKSEMLGTVVASLDKPTELPAGEVYLKKIEPNWYILFQKFD